MNLSTNSWANVSFVQRVTQGRDWVKSCDPWSIGLDLQDTQFSLIASHQSEHTSPTHVNYLVVIAMVQRPNTFPPTRCDVVFSKIKISQQFWNYTSIVGGFVKVVAIYVQTYETVSQWVRYTILNHWLMLHIQIWWPIWSMTHWPILCSGVMHGRPGDPSNARCDKRPPTVTRRKTVIHFNCYKCCFIDSVITKQTSSALRTIRYGMKTSQINDIEKNRQ